MKVMLVLVIPGGHLQLSPATPPFFLKPFVSPGNIVMMMMMMTSPHLLRMIISKAINQNFNHDQGSNLIVLVLQWNKKNVNKCAHFLYHLKFAWNFSGVTFMPLKQVEEFCQLTIENQQLNAKCWWCHRHVEKLHTSI